MTNSYYWLLMADNIMCILSVIKFYIYITSINLQSFLV